MRKLYLLGLIALAAIIIGFAWAEQFTFSTYYPSPYGVYKTMQAEIMHIPRTDPQDYLSLGKEDAMIICDDGDNTFKRWDSAVGNWEPLGAPGGGGGGGGSEPISGIGASRQERRSTNTSIPTSEATMDGMSITLNAWGGKLWVLFAAPFTKTAEPGQGEVKLYIDGSAKRKLYIKMDGSPNDYVYVGAFHHLEEGLTPGSHTVQIRWQGNGIAQQGSTQPERILTVLDIY